MSVRTTFLDACRVTTPVLASDELAAAWDRPSALDYLTVGALAGHLVRAVTSVTHYLEQPEREVGPEFDAPGYYLSIDGLDDDLDNDLHRAIRRRATDEAAGGHGSLLRRWNRGLDLLAAHLEREAPERVVAAFGGRTMLLDQYLLTRMVELVTHTDDLTTSLDVPDAGFAADALDATVKCLFEVARRRHGDLAVLRAMVRRERDVAAALRVL